MATTPPPTGNNEATNEVSFILKSQEVDESPDLEAAILEGVRSPHQAYDASTLERIRQGVRESDCRVS